MFRFRNSASKKTTRKGLSNVFFPSVFAESQTNTCHFLNSTLSLPFCFIYFFFPKNILG